MTLIKIRIFLFYAWNKTMSISIFSKNFISIIYFHKIIFNILFSLIIYLKYFLPFYSNLYVYLYIYIIYMYIYIFPIIYIFLSF